MRTRLLEIALAFIGWPLIPMRARRSLLRAVGLTVGNHANIDHGVLINGRQVQIGSGAYIGVRCVLDAPRATLRIGPLTSIATGSRLLTVTHDIGPHDARAGARTPLPTTIGAGCWLGAGVTVLPGVTIADGCVIGAGAVVATDTSPDGVYVGVPARRVRDLGPFS